MEIGMLHTHVLVVTLFLLFLLFKTILLLANKKELLTKVRTKFKMVDPILGVLMLATGGYLLSLYGTDAPNYLWIKLIVVLIIIPIGIVAFKKENKAMAIISLLLTFYIYGVSETGSVSFSKNNQTVSENNPANSAKEVVIEGATADLLKTGKEVYLAECKKCHGNDGKKGLFKSPDLTQSKLNLSERVAWIKKGKGVMPAYENELSAAEIEAVALYLEELK